MMLTTSEMNNYKIVRVLKDPTANLCSLLCCCKNQFPVNKDDENVVQANTQNTMLFSISMINGVTPE